MEEGRERKGKELEIKLKEEVGEKAGTQSAVLRVGIDWDKKSIKFVKKSLKT